MVLLCYAAACAVLVVEDRFSYSTSKQILYGISAMIGCSSKNDSQSVLVGLLKSIIFTKKKCFKAGGCPPRCLTSTDCLQSAARPLETLREFVYERLKPFMVEVHGLTMRLQWLQAVAHSTFVVFQKCHGSFTTRGCRSVLVVSLLPIVCC